MSHPDPSKEYEAEGKVTPRPWRLTKWNEWEIIGPPGVIGIVGKIYGDADATHIVHCVNMHEELIGALQLIVATRDSSKFWAIVVQVLAKATGGEG